MDPKVEQEPKEKALGLAMQVGKPAFAPMLQAVLENAWLSGRQDGLRSAMRIASEEAA